MLRKTLCDSGGSAPGRKSWPWLTYAAAERRWVKPQAAARELCRPGQKPSQYRLLSDSVLLFQLREGEAGRRCSRTIATLIDDEIRWTELYFVPWRPSGFCQHQVSEWRSPVSIHWILKLLPHRSMAMRTLTTYTETNGYRTPRASRSAARTP